MNSNLNQFDTEIANQSGQFLLKEKGLEKIDMKSQLIDQNQ